jgi:hypothetical protein
VDAASRFTGGFASLRPRPPAADGGIFSCRRFRIHGMALRLLNKSEEATYLRLSGIAGDHSALVFAKVRVADVLQINRSGISNEQYHYALSAHFDFVVTDAEYLPLFAVEFDGPHHKSSERARQNDFKKDSICSALEFPLLRINSLYIGAKYRGMDLLTYFASCWFLWNDFNKAQADGIIPLDEPFDPCMILYDGNHKERWPYWLSAKEQIYIQDLYEQKKVLDPCTSDWVGLDLTGNYRCLAWIQVAEDAYLMSKTGMRSQLFPVSESDLLTQLSVFDIRRELDRYFERQDNAVARCIVEAEITKYRSRYQIMQCGGVSNSLLPRSNDGDLDWLSPTSGGPDSREQKA